MSSLNLLWAILLACWCDCIIGLTAGLSMSARHHNPLMVGEARSDVGKGIGVAGGGDGDIHDENLIPGSISYRPHITDEIEKAIYDPGDELLRVLNAEATAAESSRPANALVDENDYIENIPDDLAMSEKYHLLQKIGEDIQDEQDIVSKSAMLMKLLEDPTIDTLPVVYIEESPGDDNTYYPLNGDIMKRSRYYRRYPWKRHSRNRGSNYEPEIRYACTPSKEDVFKLLVGLHENRNGNHHKTVNFCNRKRPAKAIFTNIRFLG